MLRLKMKLVGKVARFQQSPTPTTFRKPNKYKMSPKIQALEKGHTLFLSLCEENKITLVYTHS